MVPLQNGSADMRDTQYAKAGGSEMLTSVRGIYKNGKIELYEEVTDIETAEVIVTFIPEESQVVDLEARGFTTELAFELRQRLLTFEEDWNAPGMEAYDEL
jgi:hypothetical protein